MKRFQFVKNIIKNEAYVSELLIRDNFVVSFYKEYAVLSEEGV